MKKGFLQSNIVICFLVFFCVSVMLVPSFHYYWYRSDGNPLYYNVKGSYYRDQIEIIRDLASVIPKNSSFITYGFDAFYYMSLYNFNHFDLYYGDFWVSKMSDMSYIQQAVEAKDLQSVLSALNYLDVNYLLLPNDQTSGAYSMLTKFNEKSDLFLILQQTGSILLIKSYGNWIVYKILY